MNQIRPIKISGRKNKKTGPMRNVVFEKDETSNFCSDECSLRDVPSRWRSLTLSLDRANDRLTIGRFDHDVTNYLPCGMEMGEIAMLALEVKWYKARKMG
ncbi:uncharacterized protein TNCV_766501 [Trichonephila clavipes]|nr:uncharacterized protein TNCV_766501 [Trichonephila clavipes]